MIESTLLDATRSARGLLIAENLEGEMIEQRRLRKRRNDPLDRTDEDMTNTGLNHLFRLRRSEGTGIVSDQMRGGIVDVIHLSLTRPLDQLSRMTKLSDELFHLRLERDVALSLSFRECWPYELFFGEGRRDGDNHTG